MELALRDGVEVRVMVEEAEVDTEGVDVGVTLSEGVMEGVLDAVGGLVEEGVGMEVVEEKTVGLGRGDPV